VQAIDATGCDRRAASRRYARRTKYTFKTVKTTVLVDCETITILDTHLSMTGLHDTQIGGQLLQRNLPASKPSPPTKVTTGENYDENYGNQA